MTHREPSAVDAGGPPPGSGADTLHGSTRPETWWTTTNVAEAAPGVQTPLAWSMWEQSGELALRGAFYAVGALSRAEAGIPADSRDRVLSIFRGRLAGRVDYFCDVGDRVPGRRGSEIATQLFSFSPPGREDRAGYRYYPRVLAKSGLPMTLGVREARANRQAVIRFWSETVGSVGQADDATLRGTLLEAQRALCSSQRLQATIYLGAVQPAFDAVRWAAESAGLEPHRLMAGHGNHDESALLTDLWACSREQLALEEFLRRHGYHGPDEGNLAATVWREDPGPVLKLIERYSDQPDTEAPAVSEQDQTRQRRELEKELLSRTPAHRRPLAAAALRFGARYLPLRGLSKSPFVMSIDAARAVAREIGTRAVQAGRLETRDDVFFLTLDELTNGPLASGAGELVRERRSFWERYRATDLPGIFKGNPEPSEAVENRSVGPITGTGASGGIAEGTARVMLTPDGEFDDGDILIARHTDPGWVSIMYLSAGLVCDIGGVMSHTAVIARELGIPCVVDTKNATRTIHDGDRIRIDGTAGTIEILSSTHT